MPLTVLPEPTPPVPYTLQATWYCVADSHSGTGSPA